MINQLKIALLKSKMKSAYLSYNSKLDSYSCGRNLAESISPDLAKYKNRFNSALEKLKALDSSIPESIKPL